MAITHVYDVKYSDDGAIMNLRCPVCGRKIAVDLVTQTTHVIKPGNQAVSHVMNSGGVYMTASVDAGPIPEDYHIDPYTLARELDLGREDW